MTIKNRIASIRRGGERIKWIVITSMHHVIGRWYVFRDAPLWFVVEVAGATADPKDELEASYVLEAQAEFNRRIEALVRQTYEAAGIQQ